MLGLTEAVGGGVGATGMFGLTEAVEGGVGALKAAAMPRVGGGGVKLASKVLGVRFAATLRAWVNAFAV